MRADADGLVAVGGDLTAPRWSLHTRRCTERGHAHSLEVWVDGEELRDLDNLTLAGLLFSMQTMLVNVPPGPGEAVLLWSELARGILR